MLSWALRSWRVADIKKTMELGCKVYFYLGTGLHEKCGTDEPLTILEYAATVGFGSVNCPPCTKLMEKLVEKLESPPWGTGNKPTRFDEVIATLIRLLHPNCTDADIRNAG